jgi:CHASE2 domain-containing sensor protein
MSPPVFRLDVQKVEQVCLFELSWGEGQRIRSQLHYPPHLTILYQEWQRAYLSFYKTSDALAVEIPDHSGENNVRGWSIASGNVNAKTTDWYSKVVEAEARLLNQFHHWLRSAELFDIRSTIARPSQGVQPDRVDDQRAIVRVFLTCTPLELARFPWEAWEIGAADFSSAASIRVMRCPGTIRSAGGQHGVPRNRARILAVMGDDTGLNFQADRSAVQSLAQVAEVTFVGWQPGQTTAAVKEQVRAAIMDAGGWDVLFFAGHSNETDLTGGELGVAPGVSIAIQELAAALTIAQKRGLQVAIFNSCSGLSIAESLIDLGFSQVAVMREPIHNRVAQVFLLRFLRSLADYHDVHDSLLAACQYLRMEKNLTYPSAYLVPSLFCHPGAPLFRIARLAWQQQIRAWLPSRWESIAIALCIALSIIPKVQETLLDRRLWVQAVYRQWTRQIPPPATAPVALIQIDETSIRRDPRIANPTPINRLYLADLIQQLSKQKASIVGIDYLLDRPVGGEPKLAQALQSMVQRDRTWIVFGAPYNSLESKNLFAAQESGIATPAWTMQGHMTVLPQRMTLPYPDEDCRTTCPLGYLLALTQLANREIRSLSPPNIKNNGNLRTQLLDQIAPQLATNRSLSQLNRSRLSPISAWSYETLGVVWLEPIVDFSIPPDRVYDRVAAWRLLEKNPVQLPSLSSQIILIGAGEYNDSGGIVGETLDLYPTPAALRYWQTQHPKNNNAASFPNGTTENTPTYLPKLTGAELHAYTVHHLLNRHLIIPIPDLWCVGLAMAIGKGLALIWERDFRLGRWSRHHRRRVILGLSFGSIVYGGLGLQSFISGAILLPWTFPIGVIWIYSIPAFRRTLNDTQDSN